MLSLLPNASRPKDVRAVLGPVETNRRFDGAPR